MLQVAFFLLDVRKFERVQCTRTEKAVAASRSNFRNALRGEDRNKMNDRQHTHSQLRRVRKDRQKETEHRRDRPRLRTRRRTPRFLRFPARMWNSRIGLHKMFSLLTKSNQAAYRPSRREAGESKLRSACDPLRTIFIHMFTSIFTNSCNRERRRTSDKEKDCKMESRSDM